MDRRRDALAGAAKLALDIRRIAAETGDGAVCTSGGVVCRPGIVTSVVETAEQLLDQRHLDAGKLAAMLAEAKRGVRALRGRGAHRGRVVERIWSIEPILFDETLIGLAEEAITEVAGTSHRLPSGPLHDAAEVARAGIPTVMVFVQSLRGLSHTKLEDTKPEHLELSVQALDRLASKALAAFTQVNRTRTRFSGLSGSRGTVTKRRQAPLLPSDPPRRRSRPQSPGRRGHWLARLRSLSREAVLLRLAEAC